MTEMCQEIRDAVALDGRAPESEDAQKHLSECTECARFLKSVVAVENALHGLEADDVSNEVVDELLARPELASMQRSRHVSQWTLGVAAAVLISVIAVSLTTWSRHEVASEFYGYGGQETGGGPVGVAELSDEVREQLGSLGYAYGPPLEVEEEPAFERNETSRDNVVRREGFENRLGQDEQDKLKRQILEQNERGYYAFGDEVELDDSKNEVLKEEFKKDAAAAGVITGVPGGAFGGRVDDGAGSRTSAIGSEETRRAQQEAADTLRTEPSAAGKSSADTVEETVYGLNDIETNDQDGQKENPENTRSDLDAQLGRLYQEVPSSRERLAVTGPEPTKLVHVDPVFPEGLDRPDEPPTVELHVIVDRLGSVVRTVVVGDTSAFDQAAIDAVRQWKYDVAGVRAFLVTVRFEPPEDPGDAEAAAFLAERDRIHGLRFRNPRGYWANTYLPGDPTLRLLEMRLRAAEHLPAPHTRARPNAKPSDAPMRGALSVAVHADRRGITERSRLLVQVAIQATEDHGRRRPPMNVGIVLDTDSANDLAMRALVTALGQANETGDRFRLFVPGQGQVVAPDAFRHGALTVALDEAATGGDVEQALRLAVEAVHAGDDPTMPLGSSLVLLVTGQSLEDDTLAGIAHRSAVGGVPVSVVGVGASIDKDGLERLALAGQGRRYFLEQPAEASSIVDRELSASSRVVARALRLRIKLADGVDLVDVVGSHSLSERQAERVREAEKSIDLRLARNLGIEADRGEDEDGIQIVIPSFYAGDVHTILLDVVAPQSGPIADVTARYKDLVELENTVSRASLSLSRATAAPGPIETSVFKSYLAHHVSRELEAAAEALERGDKNGAVATLVGTRRLLGGLRMHADGEVAADIAMVNEYVRVLKASTEPALHAYLADSLRYAGASKRGLPRALT